MPISETDVTLAILETYWRRLREHTTVDVAIVGAGPSGLAAAWFLRQDSQLRVAIFESRLSPGGGLWGGGMGYNVAVFEDSSRPIAAQLGIRLEPWRNGLWVADSIQATAALIGSALSAGVHVFNLITVEDVVVRESAIAGLVIQSTSINMTGLHVDPLTIAARAVLDATGHEAAVATIAHRKGLTLETPSGHVAGERSMWADRGECQVVDMSGRIYPGLYVSGMAASAVRGGHRMGAVFGGMLESARKVAAAIKQDLA